MSAELRARTRQAVAVPLAIGRHALPAVMVPVAPPRSAASFAVGISGLLAACGAVPLVQPWLQPAWLKTLAVLGLVAVAMLLADAVTGGRWLVTAPALRPLDLRRVGLKLLGLWGAIATVAGAIALLPALRTPGLGAFAQAVLALLPAVLIISPFYIGFVDRRQADPNDGYWQLGTLLTGRVPDDWATLRQLALGWMVKGFFLPLMFGYAVGDLSALWANPTLRFGSFEAAFGQLIDVFYLADVMLAVVTYALTLRLFDTHIRSVEPTLSGWVVCLACYPPFNAVTGQFLPYDQDGLYWGKVFAGMPILYVMWGGAILALVLIYMLSTAAFGLRFSNLTHRGIITSGPYRWTKHPAYLAKNLSWWLISVPFIAGAGWAQAVQSCLLLGGVNLIYWLRARTEERHLSQDPDYRAYGRFIQEHGIFARLRRLSSRRSGRFRGF